MFISGDLCIASWSHSACDVPFRLHC